MSLWTEKEQQAHADEYARMVDNWLAGNGPLESPVQFIARKLAAKVMDDALAEQGLLLA